MSLYKHLYGDDDDPEHVPPHDPTGSANPYDNLGLPSPDPDIWTDADPPSSPENPTPVIDEEVSEDVTALSGIRRFILLVKLAWTDETLETSHAKDRVIKEAASASRLILGFKSENVPGTVPVTFSERMAAAHRERQVEKIRQQRLKRARLERVWGEKRPRPIADVPSTRAGLYSGGRATPTDGRMTTTPMHKYRQDTFSHDPNERTTRSSRRAREKAEQYDKELRRSMYKKEQKLDRGLVGDTRLGRNRQRKINKLQNRRAKYRKKLYGESED